MAIDKKQAKVVAISTRLKSNLQRRKQVANNGKKSLSKLAICKKLLLQMDLTERHLLKTDLQRRQKFWQTVELQ